MFPVTRADTINDALGLEHIFRAQDRLRFLAAGIGRESLAAARLCASFSLRHETESTSKRFSAGYTVGSLAEAAVASAEAHSKQAWKAYSLPDSCREVYFSVATAESLGLGIVLNGLPSRGGRRGNRTLVTAKREICRISGDVSLIFRELANKSFVQLASNV
jgi:hypothetical protein